MNETNCLVSLVVSPRAGFDTAAENLTTLFERTETPFALIYVDAGSPRGISRQVRELVSRRGGTLIRTDRFLKPTTARKLGFEHVRTPYTVFLDNDVDLSKAWLPPLLACAEQTGASYVSPLVLYYDRDGTCVHFAGGTNRIDEQDGNRRFCESYWHAGARVEEVESAIAPAATELAEFHTMLVRSEDLRRAGGLDESFATAFEHNDLCLQFAAIGCTGRFEPASVVMWRPNADASTVSRVHAMVRWSKVWIDESLDALCRKWRLSPDDPGLAPSLESLYSRRRPPIASLRAGARRIAGERGRDVVDATTDWFVDRVVCRRLAQGRPRISVESFPNSD